MLITTVESFESEKKFQECHLLAQKSKGGMPAQQSDSFDLPHSMVLNLISLITVDMGWSVGVSVKKKFPFFFPDKSLSLYF